MKKLAIVILAGLALVAGAVWYGRERPSLEPLLLFTTLPIYWAEAPDIAATLKRNDEPHWARRAIEAQRSLRPLDVLEAATMRGRHDLLMIQPRPLSPAENVALDAWVAGGGHLLLFADPALTAESKFALGDRRRPQDTVLLSPILARWGLRLEFDEDQAAGERMVELGEGVAVPVNLAGRFVAAAGRGDSSCSISAQALVAECRVGAGKVIAIADAALFESNTGQAALDSLLERAF